MDQPGDQVLSQADVARLIRAQQLLAKADLITQKLSDCGVDCRAATAYSQAIKARADALLQQFGPARITR